MPSSMNYLYYGDNLAIMRKEIDDETVDLCYIDPPFNSKRDYFQIYRGIKDEADQAQAQAFVDIWQWGTRTHEEYDAIFDPKYRHTPNTMALIKALYESLGKIGLTAYLVSMTIRLNEIWHKLKPTGSFYLHCDPTASHYLKLILDSIYVPRQGDFRNEIIWGYRTGGVSKRWLPRKHDTIFYYVKDARRAPFYPQQERILYEKPFFIDDVVEPDDQGFYPVDVYLHDVWDSGSNLNDRDLRPLINTSKERLGYPTQKPRALLERILTLSTKENEIVLDAYCGCGTTIDAAQVLGRRWIGIDLTYHSIRLVLQRLQMHKALDDIPHTITGVPKDMASAQALAHKKDDRVRKQFEIWAISEFTAYMGVPQERKGADKGIDGLVYFSTGKGKREVAAIQVKSGKVSRRDIAQLNTDRSNVNAPIAYFITLQEATKPMHTQANQAGIYINPLFPKSPIPRIQIIQVRDILKGKKINQPGLLLIPTTKDGKPLTKQENGALNLQ